MTASGIVGQQGTSGICATAEQMRRTGVGAVTVLDKIQYFLASLSTGALRVLCKSVAIMAVGPLYTMTIPPCYIDTFFWVAAVVQPN